MKPEPSFGQWVRERRRELGLTQDELARRVGCAPVTVRKIEYDDLRPSVQIAERLAMALNLALEERAAFVRQARSERPTTPVTPTPSPSPEEIGLDDLTGRSIRGYELGELIGKGGFGVVYRAVQPLVEREVAIKIILPQYANHPDFIRRFEAEAQLVARLEHPHIVPLYDYWREPSVAYLVMRLLRGNSLDAALKANVHFSLEAAGRFAEQVGSALHAAHRAGIIHRDLKPANILFDEDGNAYLSDFGIAKNLGSPEEATEASFIIGSPAYFSPEQILAEPVRPYSDIYSLGLVLYEFITGQRARRGPTPLLLIQQHLNDPLPSLAEGRQDLPPALDAVIQRATAKEPAARYPDVPALLADLRLALDGRPAGLTQPLAPDHTEVMDLTEADNPYKGLRAFGEGDAADFFGREALIHTLLSRLSETGDVGRFLAVVGPSGSGKSSVVRAGVIPALREGAIPGSEKWFIVDLVPGAHPLEELEAALLRVAVNPPESLLAQLREGERGLLRATKRILPADEQVELLLLIDQFEELFTLVSDEAERVHFLNNLVTAVLDPRSRVRLLVTLRADFMDRPLQYVDFGEVVRQRNEFVLPLTADELEQAITGPAERAGLQLEAGLAGIIVREVSGQPGGLPLLQYALSELFDKRTGRLLTKAAYQEIGGVAAALGRRAEELFQGLRPSQQPLARQLFLRLTTLNEGTDDVRRRVAQTELEGLDDNIWPVVELFGKHRLLSFDRDPATREPTVEVAHEALLREWPRLRDWLAESRDDIRRQRLLADAAAQWQTAGRDPSFLLSGSRLAQFEGWAAGSLVALTQAEYAFLQASVAGREAQRTEEELRRQRELETARQLAATEKARAEEQSQAAQRLRQRAVYLSGALVVAAILALLAFAAFRQADENSDLAENSAFVAQTAEAQALANADLAAEREADAIANAGLAATRELEAIANAELAATRQNEAEAEAAARAAAEAVAVAERETAEDQARLAFSSELVAGAIVNLDDDPELSMLLALHALTQADTFQAQEVLHEAVQASRLLQRVSAQPGEGFNGALFSPDGTRLATASFGPEGLNTQVRDAATLELLFTIPGGFLDDRWVDANRLPTLDSGTEPNTIIFRTWDSNGLLLSTTLIPMAWENIDTFDISPDLGLIAISTPDGLITVFDLMTGNKVQTLDPQDFPFHFALAFSPDGQQLISSSRVAMILWEVASGRELLNQPVEGGSAVAFSRDGKYLTYSDSKSIVIVDIASGQEVLKLFGHAGTIVSTEFNADGTRLLTAALDGSARIWDVGTGQMLLKIGLDTSASIVATLSPDGSRLATAGGSGTVQLWGIGPVDSREWLTVANNGACGLAFSPDGSLLALPACDDSVRMLDTISGQPVLTLTNPTSLTEDIDFPAFSPNGTGLAEVKVDGTVVVWDVVTGQERLSLSGHTNRVFGLAFSPDGTHLATIAYDKTARLWDATSGETVYTLDVFTETLNVGGQWIDLDFNQDGSKLVTAGGTSVKVWETATGQELLTLHELRSNAYTVAFNPDGSQLAVGLQGRAGSGVWDATTGQKLFDLSGHAGSVTDIAYSPDGKQIATSSVDGTTRLWDATTGVAQYTLTGHIEQVAHVAFSPDGTRLATQGAEGTVRIYALRLEDLVEMTLSRLTRWFTPEECHQYLHAEECPARP